MFSLEYSDGVDGPPRVWLADTDMPGLAMSRLAQLVGALAVSSVCTVGVWWLLSTFREVYVTCVVAVVVIVGVVVVVHVVVVGVVLVMVVVRVAARQPPFR